MKNNQFQKFRSDCTSNPDCKPLFDAAIETGLEYLETQYGLVLKIRAGSDISREERNVYQEKRTDFENTKLKLIDFCAHNKINAPSFNVDDIFRTIP